MSTGTLRGAPGGLEATPYRSRSPRSGQSPGRPPSAGCSRKGELEQTIAAAGEPYGTFFTLAALTGARVSELLALTWANMSISDLEEADVEFACQVDRHGDVRPTKTDGSVRTVPIPAELAAILSRHKDRARYSSPQDFVFSTCTGRPLGQRNVARALRQAQQKAVDGDGRPTFPILHERNELGDPAPMPHGALPSMHSFRHTVRQPGAARR